MLNLASLCPGSCLSFYFQIHTFAVNNGDLPPQDFLLVLYHLHFFKRDISNVLQIVGITWKLGFFLKWPVILDPSLYGERNL